MWELATEKIPWDTLNAMQVLFSCVNEPRKFMKMNKCPK
jgi:hypothetical protein